MHFLIKQPQPPPQTSIHSGKHHNLHAFIDLGERERRLLELETILGNSKTFETRGSGFIAEEEEEAQAESKAEAEEVIKKNHV